MPLANQSRPKHVPQHRRFRSRSLARRAPRAVVLNAALLSTAAVAATGVAVANGVTAGSVVPSSQLGATLAQSAAGQQLSEAELEDRAAVVSRSDSRDRTDATKEAELAQDQGEVVTRTEAISEADPRDIGLALLPEYGFSADQFPCLDSLYVSESDWRVDADNPMSSAYGIPQALTSMHDLPADYYTSAESQIRWGLEYIQDSYGSPCSAWDFKQANNWY
ncbi:MAG: aggregation-promoting factor C-terminal-like domain-containing protein [Nocardioides sp.]